jgi:short-subunit dehydrogenase
VTYLIVGASAGLGRALAYRLAAERHDLVIVSSDERDIDAVAYDLTARYAVRVAAVVADLGKEGRSIDKIEAAVDTLDEPDGLLFPIGSTRPNDDMSTSLDEATRIVNVNFLSIVATTTRLLPTLQRRPRGVVVGFGSIAATRGRGNNVLYSASKRALESYFESLRHACFGTSITVQFYILGYLDTQQAFGKHTLLPRADPDRLSERVARNLHRDIGKVYYPFFWRPICAVLRRLPWCFFKRVRF